MDYIIVHYLHFVIGAGAVGLLVGWWAQGSRRRGHPLGNEEFRP